MEAAFFLQSQSPEYQCPLVEAIPPLLLPLASALFGQNPPLSGMWKQKAHQSDGFQSFANSENILLPLASALNHLIYCLVNGFAEAAEAKTNLCVRARGDIDVMPRLSRKGRPPHGLAGGNICLRGGVV